jgi:hypothetical protein
LDRIKPWRISFRRVNATAMQKDRLHALHNINASKRDVFAPRVSDERRRRAGKVIARTPRVTHGWHAGLVQAIQSVGLSFALGSETVKGCNRRLFHLKTPFQAIPKELAIYLQIRFSLAPESTEASRYGSENPSPSPTK